ncbi:hypothetical protein [Janthinobacterium sp. SUN137]|nr:hypothetical protein [Janthinobacterium sp. SUN137]MDO8042995.1 hypothetical protein [Janthinobacterium sp. SUN137]
MQHKQFPLNVVPAHSPTIPSILRQALGGGILIGAGVMYAYNSYCSA